MEGIEGTSGLADPPPSEPVVDGAHVPSIAAAEPLLLRAGMTSLVDPSAPASDNDEADLASGRFEREAAAGEVLINDLALASAATPSDAPADAATLLSGDAGGTLAGNRVAASGGQEYGGPETPAGDDSQLGLITTSQLATRVEELVTSLSPVQLLAWDHFVDAAANMDAEQLRAFAQSILSDADAGKAAAAYAADPANWETTIGTDAAVEAVRGFLAGAPSVQELPIRPDESYQFMQGLGQATTVVEGLVRLFTYEPRGRARVQSPAVNPKTLKILLITLHMKGAFKAGLRLHVITTIHQATQHMSDYVAISTLVERVWGYPDAFRMTFLAQADDLTTTHDKPWECLYTSGLYLAGTTTANLTIAGSAIKMSFVKDLASAEKLAKSEERFVATRFDLRNPNSQGFRELQRRHSKDAIMRKKGMYLWNTDVLAERLLQPEVVERAFDRHEYELSQRQILQDRLRRAEASSMYADSDVNSSALQRTLMATSADPCQISTSTGDRSEGRFVAPIVDKERRATQVLLGQFEALKPKHPKADKSKRANAAEKKAVLARLEAELTEGQRNTLQLAKTRRRSRPKITGSAGVKSDPVPRARRQDGLRHLARTFGSQVAEGAAAGATSGTDYEGDDEDTPELDAEEEEAVQRDLDAMSAPLSKEARFPASIRDQACKPQSHAAASQSSSPFEPTPNAQSGMRAASSSLDKQPRPVEAFTASSNKSLASIFDMRSFRKTPSKQLPSLACSDKASKVAAPSAVLSARSHKPPAEPMSETAQSDKMEIETDAETDSFASASSADSSADSSASTSSTDLPARKKRRKGVRWTANEEDELLRYVQGFPPPRNIKWAGLQIGEHDAKACADKFRKLPELKKRQATATASSSPWTLEQLEELKKHALSFEASSNIRWVGFSVGPHNTQACVDRWAQMPERKARREGDTRSLEKWTPAQEEELLQHVATAPISKPISWHALQIGPHNSQRCQRR